jgi:hypothetical protein
MSEQIVIIKVPQATRIVGHAVEYARDKMVTRHVAVCSLVEGIETKEVGPGTGGRGGTLGGPREGGAVVAGEPKSALLDMAGGSQHIFVRDGPGKFKV